MATSFVNAPAAIRSLMGALILVGFESFSRGFAAANLPGVELQELLVTAQPTQSGAAALTEPSRVSFAPSGNLVYLGAPPGGHFPVKAGTIAQPEAQARQFLYDHQALFGITNAQVDFVVLKSRPGGGHRYVRFQQTYAGIPIFAAQTTIQLDSQGGIEAVLSDLELDVSALGDRLASPQPMLSEAEVVARAEALFAAKAHGQKLTTTTPVMIWFCPSVLDAAGPPHLVWDLNIGGEDPFAVAEHVLIDAITGEMVRDYTLNYSALNRQVYDSHNSDTDPGTLVRVEGIPASSIADANAVFAQFGDTYGFYSSHHNRDSVDGLGMTLSGSVRYCNATFGCPMANAFWSSFWSRMYFGVGFAADDITAHELTHGVTSRESNLVYENASGALNESFSDVWGEFVDLTNGSGNDASGVRWLMGEDIGAFRDMRDPPHFGDPDNMSSSLFVPFTNDPTQSNDWGGVHANSGVNNKLCYLLCDGDTFNGQRVAGLGISAVARLYYEVNVNLLSSGANFTDLYNALRQAAVNLGWTTADRNNLEHACAAVGVSVSKQVYVNLANACLLPSGGKDCLLGFGGPFPKVVDGANAAFPGDTLNIAAGSYNERVTFQKTTKFKTTGGSVIIGRP